MHDPHLSTDEFLSRLAKLFDSTRTANHGSVYLTQKRLSPPELPAKATDIPLPPSSPFPDLHLEHPLPVIIRASNGQDKTRHKLKLSTVVQSDDLEGFYVRYAEVCKAGMSGLKKRDRKKAKEKKKKKVKKEAPEKKT